MKPSLHAASITFMLLLLNGLAATAYAQDEAPAYEVTQAGDSVWMLRARGGNLAVSAGVDGQVLIDDQYAPMVPALKAELAKISDGKLKFVINTHYHGDHTGGNEALGAAGAIIVAHDNIRKRLNQTQFNAFLNREIGPVAASGLPVLTFSDRMSFHLNGETITVHHVPAGHTDGDSIIHFTGSDVIHMGDNLFLGMYPFIDIDAGGNVKGMIAAHDLALKLAGEDTKIIPGHGPLSGVKELQESRDMLVTMTTRIQALIDEGKTLQEIIDANPTADWDDPLGSVWITPENLTVAIHNSLKGIDHYTHP